MKYLKCISIISVFLLCQSCNLFDNNGYPTKVTFSKHGGEKNYFGDYSFYHWEVNDYNGNDKIEQIEGSANGDTVTAKCGWLIVKHVKKTSEVIFIAEPNTTKKKRRLYVYGDIPGNEFADITVVQNK